NTYRPNACFNNHTASSTDCSFSIRPDNVPLEVLLLTEQASGKAKFTSHVRIDCDDDVIVDQWQYLNAQDAWIVGHGDIFTVGHNTVGGPTHDIKDLTFLQWNRKLDAQYAGLLIRVSLYCKDKHHIGCLLAKINGTHTYADIENYQDPVYAELPETNPDFDNPTYCDPTNDNFTRRSKLDPLPGIPGMEPSYQPLNELTRTIAEPTPPPLPPISYPNGEQNEAFDYENPSTDATESCGDYDNPPQATATDTDYPTNESSDYDNPPVETNKEYTLPADGAQVTVEFMPGMSADDPITDAHEYFVLEPTDNTSM
ncbi:hypothetical protein QZH41_016213, partial [Actinostola sp. cb2023]